MERAYRRTATLTTFLWAFGLLALLSLAFGLLRGNRGSVLLAVALGLVSAVLAWLPSGRSRRPRRAAIQEALSEGSEPPRALGTGKPLARAHEPHELPTFSDVVGMDALRERLRDSIGSVLAAGRPATSRDWTGVLLHGPAGSGKDFLARAIAGEYGARFIRVLADDLLPEYAGQSRRDINAVFRYASSLTPCVLYIDEFDAIAGSDSPYPSHQARRAVHDLLQSLEEFAERDRLAVVAASAAFEALDPAVFAPGRFDRLIRLELPDEDTRATILELELERQQPGNAADAAQLADRTDGWTPGALIALVRRAFIGRAAELGRLDTAWHKAEVGQPQLVLIAGEAGIGKTRLTQEFADRVRAEGAEVLRGECIDLREGGLPYAPLRQALRGVRDFEESEIPAALDATRMPLAPPGPSTGRSASPNNAQAGRVLLFESLLRLFQRLAARAQVLLVVDDVHWADNATLDLLTFVTRNLTRARLLALLTYRPEALSQDHALSGFLTGHGSGTVSDLITLGGLAEHEVAAKVAEALDDPSPSLVHDVFVRSGGNPLFIEELVAAEPSAVSEVPPTPRELLLNRLAGVSDATRHLLRVAAVAGHVVPHEILQRVVDLPEAELTGAVREAIQARLLLHDSKMEGYTFRHALLQEAIYDDELLPGERRQLHHAYAEILTEMGAHEPWMMGAVARHRDEAGELERALPALVEAAADAERSFAFAEAERYLRRASELWDQVPDPARLLGEGERSEPGGWGSGLGEGERSEPGGWGSTITKLDLLNRAIHAALLIEEPQRAVRMARDALDLVDREADPPAVAFQHMQLARALWYAGEEDEAHVASRVAVDLVRDRPRSAAKAQVLAHHAAILALLGHFTAAQSIAQDALGMARELGVGMAERDALSTLGSILARQGERERGLALIDEARTQARAHGDVDQLIRVYLNRGRALRAYGLWEDARANYLEGVTEAPKYGMDRHYVWRFHVLAARMLFLQGRWNEARALLADAREQAAGVRALLPELRIASGDFRAVEEFLARRRSKWRSDGTGLLQRPEVPVELATWQGRYEEAYDHCEQGLRLVLGSEDPLPAARLCVAGLRAAADHAETLREQDDERLDELSALATRLLGTLRRLRAARPARADGYGVELAALATTGQAEAGRLEAAPDPDDWAAAVGAWDTLGLPYPAAYARLRYAEALFAQSEAGERAVALMTDAYETALRLGAVPLGDLIRERARRTGVSLGEPPHPPVDPFTAWAGERGLTAHEQQVLLLLVHGSSDRQIAAQLSITEGTLGERVSQILRKLAVGSRREAMALVTRARVLNDPGGSRE